MKKENKKDIREIEKSLSKLKTDESKVAYLEKAIKIKSLSKKTKSSIARILEEIYLSNGRYRKAAEMLESLEFYKRAIKLYQYMATLDGYNKDEGKIKELKKKYRKSSKKIKAGIISSIIVFLISLCFLSPNFTGNVIINIERETSNWIGTLCFLISIGLSVFTLLERR